MKRRTGITTILLCTLGFAVADIALLQNSAVGIANQNWVLLAIVFAQIFACFAISIIVDWRLTDDHSSIASILKRCSSALRLLLTAAILFVPLSFSTTLFMHLATATDAPLMDAYLAGLDQTIGFDWIWFHSVTSGAIISGVLIFSYHALGPQIPLILVLYGVTLREHRLMEMLALLAVSGIPTAIGMYLLPAAGAYTLYGIEPGSFTSNAGMWHYDTLVALRSGAPYEFVALDSGGLTTFPSFHTALGLIIIYSLRNAPWMILAPIAVINLLMIISTIPEGGHHLVDVIAGFGVAAIAIAVVRQLSYKKAATDNVYM